MTRSRWLSAAVLAGALIGVTVLSRWPSEAPALDCAPSLVRLDDAGIARCGGEHALPAAAALVLGQTLDLNGASVEDLLAIPGLGRPAAEALVAARDRRGPFASWSEVDAVPGIGPARLELLRRVAEIRVRDAGAW